jgi:hypothetical protein
MRGIMKATTRTGKIFNVLTGNGNTELREMKIKYNFEDNKVKSIINNIIKNKKKY